MKNLFLLCVLLLAGYANADTTVTVPLTFTVPTGPAGPQGPAGVAGPQGSSPSAADVANAPGFAAQVAAALGTPVTPTCGAAPASKTAVMSCPSGTTGSWNQTTSYSSAAYPTCWTPSVAPSSAPAGACTAVVVAPPVTGTYARPAGNTGTGLYVAGGSVRNPDGTEFRIMGVNRAHLDQGASAAVALAGANATRTFDTYMYGLGFPAISNDFNSLIASKVVPIASNNDHGTSCSNDPASLSAAVADWVNNKTQWAPLNSKGIVNIANEWGPGNSTVWRDQNIAAIASLRAAGYTMPLMIDAGGCGQDSADVLTYGEAVAASDPQKNVILSFHLYGNTPNEATMKGYFQKFATLAAANGNLAVVIGEFGPGRNIGPSPTMITPDQVIADATASGLGWASWAWDDNSLPGCKGDDTWFDMTTLCAQYTGSPSQLTAFGTDIVGQFKALKPATAKVF